MYNPYSLDGKVVLVTGASSGIGRCTAVECSKMGAKVISTGRNIDRLNETYKMLEGDGHKQISVDMTNAEELDKLINFCDNLDGISHNAGIANTTMVKYINADKLDPIFSTNTLSPIVLTCKLMKAKKINKGGSIVFASSLSGVYCVHYGESMYAASKGAINGFAKGAALDMSKSGIRVNCVNPGIIDTNIFETNDILTPEELVEKQKYFPLKRFGKPEDVAFAIIYLLSEASAWITGADIKIDGGYTLI